MRSHIQSQLSDSGIAKTATQTADNLNKKVKRSFFKSKRRIIRNGLLSANVLLVIGVAAFIVNARNSHSSRQAPVLNLVSESTITDPLDTLSGADIAVNIAYMTGMPQTTAVQNHADSASVLAEVVPSGSQAISKPQILKTELKSKSDITEYVVAEGDTLDSIAVKFGVASKSIKWSNNLGSGDPSVGTTLIIPPVDGIVYTVKNGDTPNSLASTYRSNESRIIAFNDAEIGGLVEGERIVIPDGEIVPVRSYYGGGTAFGFRPTYGPANGYDYGWCTWHAANRRREIGRPVPTNLGNAVTWSSRARAAGMTVADVPVAGAVVWHDQSVSGYVAGGLGHVAYVETVLADGSAIVSDMNSRGVANADLTGPPAGGWARVSYRLVTPSEFYKYDFIY